MTKLYAPKPALAKPMLNPIVPAMASISVMQTARNFNPMMATAAKITIAEVEHLVEPEELDGDQIITPGIYVKRILVGADS